MPDNPWRVAQGALFGRLDRFTSRIAQLQAASLLHRSFCAWTASRLAAPRCDP